MIGLTDLHAARTFEYAGVLIMTFLFRDAACPKTRASAPVNRITVAAESRFDEDDVICGFLFPVPSYLPARAGVHVAF